MLTNDTFDLLTDLIENAFEERALEKRLQSALQAASEDQRSEIAYALHDGLQSHPDAPSSVPFSKVERYIGARLRMAEWQAKRNEQWDAIDVLDAELDILIKEFEIALLDIDDKV